MRKQHNVTPNLRRFAFEVTLWHFSPQKQISWTSHTPVSIKFRLICLQDSFNSGRFRKGISVTQILCSDTEYARLNIHRGNTSSRIASIIRLKFMAETGLEFNNWKDSEFYDNIDWESNLT